MLGMKLKAAQRIVYAYYFPIVLVKYSAHYFSASFYSWLVLYSKTCFFAKNSITIPGTWLKFTQDNLARAQQERENSVKLRGDMDTLMRACANEMWSQFNSVNNALGSRVNETKDAKGKLQAHLQKVGLIADESGTFYIIFFQVKKFFFSFYPRTCY